MMVDTMKKRGLGRGLDALLGATRMEEDEIQGNATGVIADRALVTLLPIDLIERGRYQPRRNFDEEKLRELAFSIAAQGIIQPIVVRPAHQGRYELIAGERRWRAAQLAKLGEIPALIREVDERSAMAVGIIENVQRDDLNPLEEAGALDRLINEFTLTHQQVADAIGKSRTAVTNLLRLLDLNADVKELLVTGRLDMGHARALLGLQGLEQSSAARTVVSKSLSVRETERLVKTLQQELRDQGAEVIAVEDSNIRHLESKLGDFLGAKVQIRHGATGKGKVVINYGSLDELDGILSRFN